MSSITPPESWSGTFVPSLDALMFVREKIRSGSMPEVFIGRLDVWVFRGFVDGINSYRYFCGVPDDEFMEFMGWLRDVKGEWPSLGGWPAKYLADFDGDHRAAIMRFLDRCAEFVALRRGP